MLTCGKPPTSRLVARHPSWTPPSHPAPQQHTTITATQAHHHHRHTSTPPPPPCQHTTITAMSAHHHHRHVSTPPSPPHKHTTITAMSAHQHHNHASTPFTLSSENMGYLGSGRATSSSCLSRWACQSSRMPGMVMLFQAASPTNCSSRAQWS